MPANVQFEFKGPPTALKATTTLPLPGPGAAPMEIEFNKQRIRLLFRPGARGAPGFVSFRLPPETPPGNYKGTVYAGDETYPAAIQIEEFNRIVVEPASLALKGAAGEEAAGKVSVQNAGNVAQKLASSQAITLRKAGAMSRGIQKAFKQSGGDIASKLIVLGKQLSSEPEMQATFKCSASFNTLARGEAGTVEIRVKIPGETETAVWTGNLAILSGTAAVTLDVVKGKPRVVSPKKREGKG
jgi:hypothetical protein